jgi:hypothetical protein
MCHSAELQCYFVLIVTAVYSDTVRDCAATATKCNLYEYYKLIVVVWPTVATHQHIVYLSRQYEQCCSLQLTLLRVDCYCCCLCCMQVTRPDEVADHYLSLAVSEVR